ncbi:PhzF family phenazine biosynthesis protein [Aquimarina sp. AD1]|uniref:PhzF family phenazine biosynthesis protein n=1 Tax=Aquimarina sp. (strain AD1) TaxID=1714848 RepID=UPI000E4EE131|nr:PhzF family phenazine biosynthesis protein [Aquimarina sp. AD1]AXT58188.1 PhzF family phenazine biosynthesis protein [Aquimarina sp. AD1]RKN24645.1 PhzF family phenazine biosynthesis isomerase [Aquimarina sp. AD1]
MGSLKKIVIVQVLNAFAENGKGGNPAGVVLNADELSDKNKLEVSKKVGLSETAFVSKSKTEDYKLDFFTPTKQIAHCGHATVATFSYLKQIGLLKNDSSSKETIDGRRKIEIIGDLAFMEQLVPKYTDVNNEESIILKSLGLKKKDLIPNAPIKLVNTGNSFILIPVKNNEILKNIIPKFDLISDVSDKFDLIGYYVFSTDTKSDATSRMFAPSYGILEESGTGMAAGPLACYLFDILKIKKKTFHIQQGKYMKEPSSSMIIVKLQINEGEIKNLMAGGKGILNRQLKIEIDD